MSTVLGVDYGQRRIGLAVSDPMGIVATALRSVEVSSRADAVRAVAEAAGETEADAVVVGLPLNMNGSRGPMVASVERFVEALQAAVEIPISLWDERLSTSLVERSLLAGDVRRNKRKAVRDKLAAQVILQGYLDSCA